MIAILHLSDIHICERDNPIATRVNAVAAVLRAEATKLDACFIVLSGDVAFSGLAPEYSIAHRLLLDLHQKITSDHSTAQVEFVVVPGNHDCDFQRSSDLRELAIGSVSKGNVFDVDGDIVRSCLSVQDKFFEFSKALTGHLPSAAQRLYSESEYRVGTHKIRFHLYNTAWVSRLHESPGTLYYPVSVASKADSPSRPVDVAVSVLHHPLNWLEPGNARSLRSLLECTSDVILTGHEHVPGRIGRSSDTGARVDHVEGAVLQERDNEESSGFNILWLDVSSRRQLMATYSWNSTFYEEALQATWANFARNPLLAQQAFENSDHWSQVLDDSGTVFTHPRRDVLTLSDLFIYPDLFRRSMDHVVDKRDLRVPGRDLVDFISLNGNVVITGPSNSGKTSLAKRLYVDIKRRKGVVPILLDGKGLRRATKGNFLKAVVAVFRSQYSLNPDQAVRYKQLEPSQRTLIVDDFDQARLSRQAQKELVEAMTRFAGSVLIFADDLFMIEQLKHGESNCDVQLRAFEHCGIGEFGYRLRGKLIERWHSFGYEITELPPNFDHQIATTESLVDTLLGKNLLPSFPITILTILQTAEAGASLGTTSGSYGYLYEALITSALARSSGHVANIDTKYTYIAHLAHAFYRVGATSRLSLENVHQISSEYFSKFRINFSVPAMLSELERAQILTTIGGNYVFKYKYIYCYFVARYFRDTVANSSELRAELERISSRLHVEDYVNILVFYLYLTRDIGLIENVLKIARQVYADHKPCDFESDVKFVNRLYVDTKPLLLPAGEPAMHRDEERERRDLTETNEDDQDVRELPYGDDLDDVLKVNFALKTLHVMGQVLRNFPGSLQATVKADLASESYLLGLRTLKAILRISETNLDDLRGYLARLIREHHRISDLSELEKSTDEAVIWITLNCAFGMTKRISSAVGLHELSGTFADVLEQLGAPLAVRIIDTSIKLDHFPNVPIEEIKAIAKDTKNNHFTKRVLRDLVANHMYLFKVDYKSRQKLGAMLDIRGTDSKYILNPSKMIK